MLAHAMRCVLFSLVVMATAAHATPTLSSQSDPYPGIHREIWVDAAIPTRIHLLKIDLTSAELALYATKESDSGARTSELSDLLNAQVAINGGPFQVSGFRPRGLAVGDSTAWTMTGDTPDMAVLHFRRSGERTVAAIVPPETQVDTATLPNGTEGVISGRPLLVRSGNIETFDCNDALVSPCVRGPRTAVGISADGNTMWLVVVNGWQSASHGFTASEVAQFIRARGAFNAVAFDGGASSTMVINGAVANTPSDGVERTVANHLAVKYGALPKGEMVGFICATADLPNCGTNENIRVDGAKVTLDDGRSLTATNGYFGFSGITPRLACITVKKTGYLTKVQCKPVKSNIQTYNSVIMEMGVDMPDAGVPDAPVDIDASTDDGGTTRPDGGFPDNGGGGGCCDAQGDLGRAHTGLVVGVLVAWRLRRRRGTKA